LTLTELSDLEACHAWPQVDSGEMDLQRRLTDYSTARLDGRSIPVDLNSLLSAIWGDASFAGSERDPRTIFDIRLLEPGQSHPLLSHDYLNDTDRANPAIMANVEAMKATSALCCFVFVTDDGELVGYWRGPDRLEPDKAPIVLLDTEGQYNLLPGRTILQAMYLLMKHGNLAERLEEAGQALAKLGVSTTDADLAETSGGASIGPGDYRKKVYAERRKPQG
jgi:hypothetical protein